MSRRSSRRRGGRVRRRRRRRAPLPRGLPQDRRRRRTLRAGPRSAVLATRMRCGPRGNPGVWPRASASAPGAEAFLGACACPDGLAGGLERRVGLLPQRRAEVVASALGPELALQLAELLQQGFATTHLCLAPYALRLGDDGSVGLLPRRAEGPHQLGFLSHRTRAGLTQGRLTACLPHP